MKGTLSIVSFGINRVGTEQDGVSTETPQGIIYYGLRSTGAVNSQAGGNNLVSDYNSLVVR